MKNWHEHILTGTTYVVQRSRTRPWRTFTVKRAARPAARLFTLSKMCTPAAAEWHLRFWSHTPDVRMDFPLIFHLKCLLVGVNLHWICGHQRSFAAGSGSQSVCRLSMWWLRCKHDIALFAFEPYCCSKLQDCTDALCILGLGIVTFYLFESFQSENVTSTDIH